MTQLNLNPVSDKSTGLPQSVEPPGSRWKGPILSVLLSLLFPGLGQLRNRQPRKGMLIAIIAPLLLVFGGYGRPLHSFNGMIVFLVVGILWEGFICVDAFRYARHGRETRKTFQQAKGIFLVSVTFIVILPFIDSATYFLHKSGYYRAFKIPSASMCPTICVGDRIVADMDAFVKTDPHRGDVILMKYSASNALFIKRVVGIGGDVVLVKPGEISVNGQRLSEPPHEEGCGGATLKPPPYEELVLYGEVKVPVSSFFVVGDNLPNSFDSRFPGFGLVRSSQIRGKPLYIYWSPNSSRIGCPIQ